MGRRLHLPPPWLVAASLIPAALVALPFGYVALRSWQAGPGGIAAELIRPYTLHLLLDTLTLATAVSVLAVLLATAAAWCTERCTLPAPQLWRVAMALPMAVPSFVMSYAYASLGPSFQGMAGAILILTLYSTPLVYLPVSAAFRSLDPSFEDVARSLGHGPWRSFRRAVLPQAMPAIGGGALLVAAHMLAEFGALSFLQVETFTTAIFDQYQTQFDNAAAALLSGVLILLCIPVVYAEIRLRRGMRFARLARGGTRRPPPIPLGWVRLPVMAGLALYAALGFGLPLATLAVWFARGSSAGHGFGRVGPALAGSLGYALPGAVLTTALALPLVLATTRYRGRLATLADRLPYLVHGVPGIVVALALVSVAIRAMPVLYQSNALVLAAYAILFLPLAQSSIRASAVLVPPELGDVARSLGRGPAAAFLFATLPNLMPGIGAGLALIALQLMRELTATLLLAPSGVVTLATEFWSYTNDHEYAAAAPFAAALVLVSGLPVYLFTLRALQAGRQR